MEKKLTDDEIVKALECCTINYPSCEGCPLYNDINCATKATENAVDLIHRLRDENEGLKKLVKVLEDVKETLLGERKEQKAKIERQDKEYIELDLEARELRTKVDELTAFKNEAISMSLYGKGRKDGEEVGYQQAVKDTAREIYDKVEEIWIHCPTICVLAQRIEKWIKERYGVEVE